MTDDFLTVYELADLLKMHPNTIYKAVRSGRINAFRVSFGRKAAWRIPKTEITRLATLDFKLLET